MRQQHADGHALFAGFGAELGEKVGDFGIEVQRALIVQDHRGRGRRDHLGDGGDVINGAGLDFG